ncbi:NADPH-dependent F420 reductase [Mucilaginibacter aquariorum]|uniref:NAD(P)-binding domain-containing protein n=1 Tax=Mucilaginibacter aquariorum TaxID=2967225 RepID=A0ABT1SXW8_9SPHI|nr:NAD(P)-binding domain-containing protein [Mucilaginibacter aquariorum]MCQ6957198.1 NAD(P)-binding domain-containing protein [Mucilaginibacter aquariorum]
MKTIGIIGAGHIGQAIALQLLKINVPVLISNSRGPETLQPVLSKLGNGAKAVSAKEAAEADMVILALPWWKVNSLSGLINWSGKVVIDITNEFLPGGKIADLGDKTSTGIVLEQLHGARIVKAFNTLFAARIAADPVIGEGRRVAFVAGDDQQAKSEVAELIKSIGFAPIDLGTLAVGGRLTEAKGVFSGMHLVKL